MKNAVVVISEWFYTSMNYSILLWISFTTLYYQPVWTSIFTSIRSMETFCTKLKNYIKNCYQISLSMCIIICAIYWTFHYNVANSLYVWSNRQKNLFVCGRYICNNCNIATIFSTVWLRLLLKFSSTCGSECRHLLNMYIIHRVNEV